MELVCVVNGERLWITQNAVFVKHPHPLNGIMKANQEREKSVVSVKVGFVLIALLGINVL